MLYDIMFFIRSGLLIMAARFTVLMGRFKESELEKFFSAAVELEDGERMTIRVKGPNLSAVFQQVKAMPGIRRVGKVSELSSPDAPVASERAHNRPPTMGARLINPGQLSKPRALNSQAWGRAL